MSKKNSSEKAEEPLALYRVQVENPFAFWDLATAVSKISEGLSTYILEVIRRDLQLSNVELARVVSISPRTLARRKKEIRLPSDESERAYRVARLIEIAADILGSKEETQGWMKENNFALGNQRPLDLIRTEPGAQLVERILRQIEHGITV